jgi:hypothetical protein
MAEEPPLKSFNYYHKLPKRATFLETPQERRYRHRRIWFRIGLFVLLAPINFYFGLTYFTFHRLTRPTSADFVGEAQQCIPVVIAAKQYQRDTANLPQTIYDLQPKYLAALPQKWCYFKNGEFFELVGYYSDLQAIAYDFTPGNEHWEVAGPFAPGRIPLPPVAIAPVLPPSTQPN